VSKVVQHYSKVTLFDEQRKNPDLVLTHIGDPWAYATRGPNTPKI